MSYIICSLVLCSRTEIGVPESPDLSVSLKLPVSFWPHAAGPSQSEVGIASKVLNHGNCSLDLLNDNR